MQGTGTQNLQPVDRSIDGTHFPGKALPGNQVVVHPSFWQDSGSNKLPRCKHTRYLEEESYFNENHPFSNFPPKYEASLGELNPIEIKPFDAQLIYEFGLELANGPVFPDGTKAASLMWHGKVVILTLHELI